MYSAIAKGLLIPFIGTSLGAACVLFMKKGLSTSVQKALSGFAAGVMVAASVWSLLIPALNQAGENGMGKLAFIPAVVGFCLGMLFLLLLDIITPHMHQDNTIEGPKTNLKKTTMMVLALRCTISRKEWQSVSCMQAGSTEQLKFQKHQPSHSQSELQFRIFPKAQSFQCRFIQTGCQNQKHVCKVFFLA